MTLGSFLREVEKSAEFDGVLPLHDGVANGHGPMRSRFQRRRDGGPLSQEKPNGAPPKLGEQAQARESRRLSVTAIIPATDAPASLERCLRSIRVAADGPDELIVVETPARSGPADARNAGAKDATGDVLVFVDSDVEVHRDAFRRIRSAFDADSTLTAIFGSYDDAPDADGVVSTFRNLLHHHVHQSSPGRATTFWAGLGAIRRDAFLAADGFDAERFKTPSVEDIDLGMRLTAAGAKIELDPALQGKHLKAWSVLDMLQTDFVRRGTPWVRIMLHSRTNLTALNLAVRHRLSTAACLVGLASVPARRPAVTAAAALSLLFLNRSFYGLLLRRLGPRSMAAGIGLHVLHHLAAAASLPAGVAAHLLVRSPRLPGGVVRPSECASTASPPAQSG